MDEPTELKAGMTATYEVAGQKITMKPLTLGKIKKAMMAFKQPGIDAFDMMRDHLVEVLDNGLNLFANKDWIEQNIDMVTANRIIEDMRKVNGLGTNNVFPVGGAPTVTEKDLQEKSKTETPSA